MKKAFLAVLLAASFLHTGCSNKESDEKETVLKDEAAKMSESMQSNNVNVRKKYPIESGIITYKRSGIIGNNKVVVYFSEYGLKERNETYNDEGKIEEIRFTDGEKMYNINFRYNDEKVAYIMGNGKYGTEMSFVPDPFRKEEDKVKYNFKKLTNIHVSGKDCEAYSTKSAAGETIFAGWNGFHLYSKVTISMGVTVTEAVSFEENAKVDPALFKVPDNFQVKTL